MRMHWIVVTIFHETLSYYKYSYYVLFHIIWLCTIERFLYFWCYEFLLNINRIAFKNRCRCSSRYNLLYSIVIIQPDCLCNDSLNIQNFISSFWLRIKRSFGYILLDVIACIIDSLLVFLNFISSFWLQITRPLLWNVIIRVIDSIQLFLLRTVTRVILIVLFSR